jgi:adenosylcobinamide hydrolase
MNPEVHERTERDHRLPFLVWRPSSPRLAVTSAPLGGGLGERRWVLNAQVERGYDRDDPADHLAELARRAGLEGPGVGLMTAVDVRTVARADDAGVTCWATVGVDVPAWAAAPDEVALADEDPGVSASVAPRVGTINLVVDVPVRLSEAALVNAVATATEAKSQAMAEAGLAGTGTPTDAVCVLCPVDGPAESYGGPRSRWGARLARAVHDAVAGGLAG